MKGYLSGGRLPLRQPCPKLNFNNTGKRGSYRKKEWIKGHLDMYMAALEEAVGPLVKEGYVVIRTDGAKEVRLGVHVAGAGVYFGQGDSRNLSEPLPYGEQTNNRAELWAFIQSLRKTSPHEKVLVISDSSYVVKGISLWSAAWGVKGWRLKGKPIPNADLVLGSLAGTGAATSGSNACIFACWGTRERGSRRAGIVLAGSPPAAGA